jgi:hypothetical protein
MRQVILSAGSHPPAADRDTRQASVMGDIEITAGTVTAAVGILGLLVELLVLFRPVFGDPERKRTPGEHPINRPRH